MMVNHILLKKIQNNDMRVSIDIIKEDEFFIASIKEFSAVLSQGTTVKEAKENIQDAFQLFLEHESD